MTLLTVDQAADRIATKPRFVRRLIAEKRIPYVKLGSHVRIDTADLDQFVAAGRVLPEPGTITPLSTDCADNSFEPDA
jgi:excisionase family DNA binding protein